ncbi:hypothetical protein ACOMHN_050515 [Nucella lapillus]
MLSLWTMFEPSVLSGGVLVLLCVLWWLSTRRPPGLPPGPGPALPVLGHLHLVPADPRAKFRAWRRQYGDVFSLLMGKRVVVVLASYPVMREAFVTMGDVFSDRPHVFVMEEVFQTKGVIGSSGPRWKEQRKTTLEILRQMGMGKNVLAEKVQEEITHYIQAIQAHQGAPVDMTRMTQISVANNVCSITFGKRYEYNDPEFIRYLENMDVFLKYSTGSTVLNYLPMLGYLPGDPFKKNLVLANISAVCRFISKQVTGHQKTLAQGEVVNMDFIFSYLQQIEDRRQREVDTTLDEPSLQNVVHDLFLAGSETISTVLCWGFVYLIRHPDVQDKCYQEILEVIGPHRPPTVRDKLSMVYMEATICEIMRKAEIIPLVLRATARDVKFRGYLIPKETVIIADLSSALSDPEIWGDPQNFRPERFIGSEGKLTLQEPLIPFGSGNDYILKSDSCKKKTSWLLWKKT